MPLLLGKQPTFDPDSLVRTSALARQFLNQELQSQEQIGARSIQQQTQNIQLGNQQAQRFVDNAFRNQEADRQERMAALDAEIKKEDMALRRQQVQSQTEIGLGNLQARQSEIGLKEREMDLRLQQREDLNDYFKATAAPVGSSVEAAPLPASAPRGAGISTASTPEILLGGGNTDASIPAASVVGAPVSAQPTGSVSAPTVTVPQSQPVQDTGSIALGNSNLFFADIPAAPPEPQSIVDPALNDIPTGYRELSQIDSQLPQARAELTAAKEAASRLPNAATGQRYRQAQQKVAQMEGRKAQISTAIEGMKHQEISDARTSSGSGSKDDVFLSTAETDRIIKSFKSGSPAHIVATLTQLDAAGITSTHQNRLLAAAGIRLDDSQKPLASVPAQWLTRLEEAVSRGEKQVQSDLTKSPDMAGVGMLPVESLARTLNLMHVDTSHIKGLAGSTAPSGTPTSAPKPAMTPEEAEKAKEALQRAAQAFRGIDLNHTD